ncbi:hypothetical protein KP509_13G048100 [Ceratopteris richardii]|uniref:EF-hand domain-containing protein n=1 Tax=Ceratopteris richardii TaxID=49495 RepID=A0A8T2TIR3_CERRI|nr:hypothetical protein KP509_13G048100 [Ceratopteris richardii]
MEKKLLTNQQISDLKEIFEKFDLDGDGSLTEQELGALLCALGLNPSAEQVTVILHNLDKNNNGFVEFSEFLEVISPNITSEMAYNQEELLMLFRKFDTDGNGFISAVELVHSMARLGHILSQKELMDMIHEADTDGDGQISFIEFVTAMTNAAACAW